MICLHDRVCNRLVVIVTRLMVGPDQVILESLWISLVEEVVHVVHL